MKNRYTPGSRAVPVAQRGVALVLVLFAVATAFILSLSFMNAQATNAGIARNVQNQANARHIAESAVSIAIEEIKANSNFRSDFANGAWVTNQSFAGGTFSIFGEDGVDTDGDGEVNGDGDLANNTTDYVTITVVATFNGATHKVRALVQPGNTADLGNVLFVVADENSLTSQESAKKSQLQTWGFTVVPISDHSSSTTFNDAISDADVIYVGEEVDSGTVQDKLTAANIGVVTEEHGLYDNIGFSSSSGTWTGTTIEILDNTHYITEEFSTGNLAIADSSTELTRLNGTIAAGANVLGERLSSSNDSLVVLDSGATMYSPSSGGGGDDDDDGGSSSVSKTNGRRVALPWGGGSFNFSDLNDNGLTILKRSLLWASVNSGGVAGFFAAKDKIEIKGDARVEGWQGAPLLVSTNSTSSDKVKIESDAQIDGDVYVGVGGNPNTVIDGVAQVTGLMAALTESVDISGPSNPSLGSSLGDVKYSSGTITIDSDMHFDKWEVENSTIVVIEGNVTILAEDEVKFKDSAQLQLADGATLTLYTKKKFKAEDSAKINENTADPTRFISYHNGTEHWDLKGTSVGYATVYAPDALFHINENTEFYGSVKADEIKIEGDAVARIGGTGEVESLDGSPKLVALYEFTNVTRPTPNLIHHWKLDEEGTGGAAQPGFFAANEKMEIKGNARVQGLNGQTLAASVNSTSSDKLKVEADDDDDDDGGGGAQIIGDAYVGVGGNPNTVIDGASGITGSKTALTTAIDFPAISIPNIGSSVGDQTYSSGTNTISSNTRFDKLTVKSNAKLRIDGDIIIVADDEVLFEDNAQLIFKAGAKLTLYTKKKFKAEDDAEINKDTEDPSRFICYHNATDHWDLKKNAIAYATVYAPNGTFHINEDTQFFGTVVADEIKVEGDAVANIAGEPSATDEIGSANGTFEDVTLGVAGQDGKAVQFDGSSSHVILPHAASMLLDEGSAAFWFNSGKLTSKRGLFSKDSADYDNGGHLHIFTDGTKVKAQLDTDGSDPFGTGDDYEVVSTTTLSTSTWYHVTVTWGPHGFRLFVDGSLEDIEEYIGGTGTTSGGTGNTEPIVLGATTTNSDDGSAYSIKEEFEGLIDDVRIYDRALSASQATNLSNGAALGDSDDPGLVIEDTSNFGDALNMTVERGYNIAYSGTGLTLNGDNQILSDDAASKIHTALTATNEFSVELIIETDDIAQFGPATIVSNSSTSSTRNFMLGQVDQTLLGRVRTTDTAASGTPDVETPSSTLQASTQTHVILAYDGENVTLYVNGSAVTTEARTGDLDDWSSSMKLMFANEFGTDRPWHGTLHRAAIWDTGFNAVQALNVFDGNEPGDGSATNAFRVTWVEIP